MTPELPQDVLDELAKCLGKDRQELTNRLRRSIQPGVDLDLQGRRVCEWMLGPREMMRTYHHFASRALAPWEMSRNASAIKTYTKVVEQLLEALKGGLERPGQDPTKWRTGSDKWRVLQYLDDKQELIKRTVIYAELKNHTCSPASVRSTLDGLTACKWLEHRFSRRSPA